MKLSRSRPYVNPTPVPKMPTGLVELMEGLSREVIKNNPSDLFSFCAEHMNRLLELRDGRKPKTGFNLEERINIAKKIVKQRAEQRRINNDTEIYISPISLMDKKSHETNVSKDGHQADKNSETAESKEIQTDENVKAEESKANDVIEIEKSAPKECNVNNIEIETNDSIKVSDSVVVASTERVTDVVIDSSEKMDEFIPANKHIVKDNEIEVSKQEDTLNLSDVTNEKINDITNVDTRELSNVKEDEYNTISSISTRDIQIDRNHEEKDITCSKEETNKELDLVNKVKNMPLPNEEEGIETMNNSNLDEITATDMKIDEIKSDEMYTTITNGDGVHNINIAERGSDFVSSEQELKNNDVVQSKEEVHNTTTTEQFDESISGDKTPKNDQVQSKEEVLSTKTTEKFGGKVSGEETPKNYQVQSNEEVLNTTTTEKFSESVSGEETPNNDKLQSNEEVLSTATPIKFGESVSGKETPKNNQVQSNEEVFNRPTTEQLGKSVSGEDAPKNDQVQSNEQVLSTPTPEKFGESASGKETPQNNQVQSNEEVLNAATTQQFGESVSGEEMPKNYQVQSNEEVVNTATTQQFGESVSGEEMPKNDQVHSNEEVLSTPTPEKFGESVPGEETPKNYQVQSNGEVFNRPTTEQLGESVSGEEAPKNDQVQSHEEVLSTPTPVKFGESVSDKETPKNNQVQSNGEVFNGPTTEQFGDSISGKETPKNDQVQSNEEVVNTATTQQFGESVSGEEMPKNDQVHSNEEVLSTPTPEKFGESVPGEETPKNYQVQSNEEVVDIATTEKTDGHNPNEAALNKITAQNKTENLKEETVNDSIQQKELNVVKENNIKFDTLETNSFTNKEESETRLEILSQDDQEIVADSGLINNDDETVINLKEHKECDVTSNAPLNEHETNEIHTEVDLKEGSLVKDLENGVVSNIKEEYSQSDHDVEGVNINDEYSNNNKHNQTTNTNNKNSMDLERAAVTIQKVFRNFLFKSKSSFDDTGSTEYNESERDAENKKADVFVNYNQNLNKERRAVPLNRMDTVLQTVNEEKSLSLSTDDSSTISSAATVIQAHVKGFLVRNRLNRNKTVSNASTSLDGDSNKSKTVLNIHIVPEGEFMSRDESLLTSIELSLDGSPPTSANLHPLGYDKSERRKQLKREDAVQSISPPTNNSGLSEDYDSVKEMFINDCSSKDEMVKVEDVESKMNKVINTDITERKESELEDASEDKDSVVCKPSEQFTDELDVVTPFKANGDKNNADIKLLHSGEFHDLVLPTKVSRSDKEVVSGE